MNYAASRKATFQTSPGCQFSSDLAHLITLSFVNIEQVCYQHSYSLSSSAPWQSLGHRHLPYKPFCSTHKPQQWRQQKSQFPAATTLLFVTSPVRSSSSASISSTSHLPHYPCRPTSQSPNNIHVSPPLIIIPSNQIFFIYLRATVPFSPSLANSSLHITASAAFASGGSQEPRTYTIPLKTASYGDNAHLAIRNATGAYVESLSAGRNDVLADFLILGLFLRTGWWTFYVEGVLPDGGCLFCFGMRQWLEHKNM